MEDMTTATTPDDSAPGSTGTPDPNASTAPAGDAAAQGSKGSEDGDSTLKSRYAGQTAKVGELENQKAVLQSQLEEAQRLLGEAQKGVIDKDQALKDQIKAKDDELVAARREAHLIRVEAKYPEAFKELGELAADMPAEKLASLEARLTAALADEETPTPRGINGARERTAPVGAPKTVAEAEALLRRQRVPGYSTQ